jgi:hypothetical protein
MFVVRICLFVLFVGAPILQDLGRGGYHRSKGGKEQAGDANLMGLPV